jgi:hypothetical protein
MKAIPKKDRHPATLDAFLHAREYQTERFVPTYRSGYLALFGETEKAGQAPGGEYGGVSGYQAGTGAGPTKHRPVGGMSMHSKPARSPGDDPYVAQKQDEHPASQRQQAKRKKKRRTKEPGKKKKRMVLTGESLRDVEGHARGREMYHTPLLQEPQRDAERNHEWLADEAERRTQVGRRSFKMTINPRELR